jgi:adenylosuccinate lyase
MQNKSKKQKQKTKAKNKGKKQMTQKTQTNQLNQLNAISPLDGRYFNKTNKLSPIFSEYGLIFYRLQVEIKWFIELSNNPNIKELPNLNTETISYLENIINNFNISEAEKIKKIENTTNHDVKAIEYYIQNKFKENSILKNHISFIHFACTSEDINNCSHALMLKSGRDVITQDLSEITQILENHAKSWIDISMMARTHGQPASPTTLGKEFLNVYDRAKKQIKHILDTKIMAKINGAVGNFNAHSVAYPDINWPEVSKNFITKTLGLNWQAYTTQIEPHDYISELFHAFARINNIFIDLSRDCWSYISIGYFKQKLKAGEVGSSTMPHKVNPIDFENAEGNLGIANSLLNHLANKLPISRWQRDLTDSTVLRNMGVALGYCLLSYKSLIKGLNKLEVNVNKINQDINAPEQSALLGEAVQTVMRKYGISDAYEQLKAFTRGKDINNTLMQDFIKQLDIPEQDKKTLISLTPSSYIGLAKTAFEWS